MDFQLNLPHSFFKIFFAKQNRQRETTENSRPGSQQYWLDNWVAATVSYFKNSSGIIFGEENVEGL